MSFSAFWTAITKKTRPIRTIFGLYVTCWLVPVALFALLVHTMKDHLITPEGQLNIPVTISAGFFTFCATVWTAGYVWYFTKQRKENPDLYKEGFMTDFTVREGEEYGEEPEHGSH